MSNVVYLALGSNLGKRNENLRTALKKLATGVKVNHYSSFYDTAPAGNTRQPRFLNMVSGGETEFTPREFLSFIKTIEVEMGRTPGALNSPRPIDIDILFYGRLVINAPELVIPHPRLAERVFVLLPLLEIVPELRHPVTGKTVREMLREIRWMEQDIKKLEEKP